MVECLQLERQQNPDSVLFLGIPIIDERFASTVARMVEEQVESERHLAAPFGVA